MATIKETVNGLRGAGRGWTLLFVALGWLLINGFRFALPALLPQIKLDFGIGNASAGFALTVLWFMYAGLQFPSGLGADRVGERRLLVGGTVLGMLGLGAFYITPVFALFLLACALFGMGAGLFGTPRDMILARTYPDAVNTAYAVTFAAGSIGAAALPLVATAVAGRFGWQVAVVSLLPAFLLVALGLYRFTPGTDATGGEDRLTARQTVRLTGRALSDRTVLLGSGGMVLFIFTYQALLTFLPTYLVEIKGLEQSVAAGLFGLLFVFGAMVQPIAGHLADQYGERPTVIGLTVLATVTLLALPFTPAGVLLFALVPVLGVRIAIGPLTSAYVVPRLPESVQGAGWGLLRTVFFAVGSTGSTVIGVFADAGYFDVAFLGLAGVTAAIVVFWLLLPKPAPSA